VERVSPGSVLLLGAFCSWELFSTVGHAWLADDPHGTFQCTVGYTVEYTIE
jgi:hypothetical protein